MKIIVDAMGGDNAPEAIVKGSVMAAEKLGVEVVLVGDEAQIKSHLSGSGKNISIVHTTQVITCDDDPVKSIRSQKDSSVVVGMKMTADGQGDAFVSAGSTGAVISGATLIIKRIKGIRRVALAPILPSKGSPTLLIDCGANADCTVDFLTQFAVMGRAYAKAFMGVAEPKIGLLNNGAEASKGSELAKDAYKALDEMPINFIGNIEAREALNGVTDVLVTDGFTGNILLKSIEGTAKFMSVLMKEMFTKNIITKICAIILSKEIKNFKNNFSQDEYGGAPVLGASKVVIKAHGSAEEYAFYNAIRQAKVCVEQNLIAAIEQNI